MNVNQLLNDEAEVYSVSSWYETHLEAEEEEEGYEDACESVTVICPTDPITTSHGNSTTLSVVNYCEWLHCEKTFRSFGELLDHITFDHVGMDCTKPLYRCQWKECGRFDLPFQKRHKFLNHLRTHTGEKPYTCEKEGCGKSFARADSLTTHRQVHLPERPYECDDCGRRYFQVRSLRKHFRLTGHGSGSSLSTPNSASLINADSTFPWLASNTESQKTTPLNNYDVDMASNKLDYPDEDILQKRRHSFLVSADSESNGTPPGKPPRMTSSSMPATPIVSTQSSACLTLETIKSTLLGEGYDRFYVRENHSSGG